MPNFDPRKTALVLIDLQQWTLGMPMAPYTRAQVMGNAVRLAESMKSAGALLVLVRVGFSQGFADAPPADVDVPIGRPEGGLSESAMEFAAELARIEADVVITKRQWSAFFGTELDLQLRRRGIDTIVLGGVMTNFGVESTARDAWQLNYSVIIAEDVAASFEEAMHRFAIEKVLPRVSRISSTDAILAHLKQR
ncbi:hydrolase [Phyllobacterium phragmitis]|uniref:Hydrolase n=1 Tax=Phyllobacterium phragmitis TaxID=2670329 RepID=A0A2S9IXD9_9HYPH|nr:hydrolase [Phyllobacterium phragmitis]PRD45191.1 hydrolase [Phyllobacterium phragmitis]